jgi:hypothetical protein
MSDDYDAAVAASMQPSIAQSARVGFSIAADTNPDAYAEAQRVARRTGVPVDTAMAMPDEMKKQSAMGGIDFDSLAKTSPATAGLLANIDRAKLAHDDVGNLTGIESALYSLGKFEVGTGKAIAAAVPKLSEGLWGLARAGAETFIPEVLGRKPVADYLSRMGGVARGTSGSLMPKSDGLIESSWYSGMQSLGLNAIILAGSVASGGGATPALIGMGLSQGGQSYGEARDAGRAVPESLAFGASQGIIEAGTEMIGMPALFSILKPGKFAAKAAEYLVKDQGGEQIATHLQDLNEWAVLHPEKTLGDYLQERPIAAIQTALATAFGGGGQVALMKGAEIIMTRNDIKVDNADKSLELLGQLNEMVGASKVLARDADTFEAHVQAIADNGPAPDAVFISAQTLQQSGIADQVAALSPAVADQLVTALQTGGDVRIPIGEYAAQIAPTEYAQQLVEHLKFDAEGFSHAEAQAYMQEKAPELQAEVERVLGEQSADEAWKASAQEVEDAVFGELQKAGRFTESVNRTDAVLHKSFASVMAAKLGMTPMQFFQDHTLRVIAEQDGGTRFDQAGNLVTDTPAFKAWFGESKVVDKTGKPIVVYHGAPDMRFVSEDGVFTTMKDRALKWGFTKESKKDAEASRAFFFTTSQGVAKTYANPHRAFDYQAAEEGVIPAYISLKSPLVFDANGAHWREAQNKISKDDFIAKAKKEGHDGVVIKNVRDSYDSMTTGRDPTSDVYVAFSSNQIKHATGNNGNFDPSDPSVLRQTTRGSFNPATNTIALLKNADLSTFLHESAHFFLEVQASVAGQLAQDAAIHGADTLKPGERQILDDQNALLAWFGVKDVAEWNNLDFEEKRAYHEQFARGFEVYLFEGKAPSIELHGVFQRFRAWLLNVYKSLTALNVEVTPEVRSVFDRMLATTEQIQLAEQARSMMPLFERADQAGMTPEDFSAYQAQGIDASNSAIEELQARGLRDMQWLHNARGRVIKKLQKESNARRAEVRMDAKREIMSQPVYQAWEYLTGKDKATPDSIMEDADGNPRESHGRLDRASIDGMDLPADVVARLDALKMVKREALHPDIVAELFGFSSGDEMVRSLAAADKPNDAIEGLTDQRMLEQYGDLSSQREIEQAADQAIHNEARARMVATEANALAKATGKPKILAEAAKAFAGAMIARLKVRNIKPGQYANAEVRASKAAQKASRSGDLETAAAEKRNQLINNYATRAAYDAQAEAEKAVRYFRAIDKSKTLPTDYLAQIQMLLDKYDLRDQSGAAIDRKTSLRTWVQSRLNLGEIPAISESLLSPAERKAYEAAINARDEEGNLVYPDDDERIKLLADAIESSAKRSYKDLTVEELRGLNDTIKQIEHLGRLKDKLLTKMEGAGYAATRDLLAATIEANAKEHGKNTRTDNTWLGSKLDGLKQFGASHIKPAIWMRIFDGGEDNGPWWSTVVRPANERATFETSRRAAATSALMELLGPVLKKVSYIDQLGKGRFFPAIGASLNWEERMAFAFNYGNESNLQRLMGGGIAGVTKALTIGQVQTVLNTLTAAEWQAVQGVWDHFETYRPEIAAKELRVNGAEPKWIDARPFTVKTADGQTLTLRGGYFPVKFDAKTSLKAQQHNDAQSSKDAMKAAYSAATTQRSFTKERVEEVTGRPLLLNLSGLYSGVNDVIHDLAWHEWVIDVNRLLRSESIDSMIREHYGANVKRELTKWRDDIVAGSARLDHGIENAAGWARKFVSSAALTYNVISALMQPLGITQSFARVGAKWVGMGLGQYVSGPVESTKMVQGKSEYMTNRTRTMFRDINELRNRVNGQTLPRELMGRYGYYLTMHFQMMVDVPTWIGAYEKALAGGHSDDVAIALADQSVKDSQGGGEEVDQAGITRGGPLIKLFTAFYDFMNTQANVLYLKNATATSRADKWMSMALVGLVTPVLAAALRDALIPGDSGDWDDWEKVVKKMLSEGLGNLIGMVAFGREFSQAAKALYGDDKGIGYSGPAGVRVIPDLGKLNVQIYQGEFDDAFRKAAINALGDVGGIPSVQINRTITGANALSEGKTTNPAALAFGFQDKR